MLSLANFTRTRFEQFKYKLQSPFLSQATASIFHASWRNSKETTPNTLSYNFLIDVYCRSILHPRTCFSFECRDQQHIDDLNLKTKWEPATPDIHFIQGHTKYVDSGSCCSSFSQPFQNAISITVFDDH